MDWSDDAAVESALSNAAANDPDAVGGSRPAPPVQQAATPQPSDTPAGDGPQVQPEPTQQSVEDTFTPVNPDELPEEVRPLVRQLQADYTRKTQALAEQRRQIEALGDVESLQQAVELYQRVADPNNWAQLHAELTTELQRMGYTPAQASQMAGEAVTAQQQPAEEPEWSDDPELAPFRTAFEQQQARLDALEQQLFERAQMEQAQQLHMALVGEMQRQENAILQANPHYTDEDLAAVYELSSFHNGDLIQAQQRYEAILENRLQNYFAKKSAAAGAVSTQPAPSGVGTIAEPVTGPQTIKDVGAEVEDYIRGLMAAGELSLD